MQQAMQHRAASDALFHATTEIHLIHILRRLKLRCFRNEISGIDIYTCSIYIGLLAPVPAGRYATYAGVAMETPA